MILGLMVAILMAGGIAAWISDCRGPTWPRWISLGALGLDLLLAFVLWGRTGEGGAWLAETDLAWVPELGIRFHLAVDGLSLVLVFLTLVLGGVAVAVSWTEIRERVGFFHFNLMWNLAGVLGVFLAVDLLLFYFFWELMLVPMYLLIGIWGHENRRYAAIKFFLFTQAGGLFMLVSILTLAASHHETTGAWSFGLSELGGQTFPASTSLWLLLGFFVAFAVKLPMVPLHTWLADAHTEAPTAGSVILAGLLLKTGGYGLLRIALPLFPQAALALAPLALFLAVVGILYGAVLAFAQTDFKRMVAYTSVSHLGFVLFGAFASSELAAEGALLQMVSHGLSTGALFALAGALQERLGTRDLDRVGGLWATWPRFGAMVLFFAMASLGLPGLGNFVAEVLVLFGGFATYPGLTAVATIGLVLATVYSLSIVQRAVHGPRHGSEPAGRGDLVPREMMALGLMAVLLIWLGLYPQPVLDRSRPSPLSVSGAVQIPISRDTVGRPGRETRMVAR